LRRCLRPDGLALVQVIGSRRSTTNIDPWMDRYIFPHAVLPSVAQLGNAIEPFFVMEDGRVRQGGVRASVSLS
jgi:cyclopropane-fatty-acyl-phospholipid synthase